jgi:SAM-dependent methyltransferase
MNRAHLLIMVDAGLGTMQDISSQISYWDRVAHEKRFSHPLRLDWLGQYLKTPRARILDYGCGYGRTLAELSLAGYKNIVGMDFSESMLRRCRNQAFRLSLIRNDGRSLPLKNNCFDAVILFAVLTCIPDSNEQRLLLTEVERVLRPGGLIYLSDLLVNDDARNLERYEQYAEAYKCYGVFELPEGVVVRHHQKKWIEEITRSFQMLEYEPFTVTTMNRNESAAFQYLGRSRVD